MSASPCRARILAFAMKANPTVAMGARMKQQESIDLDRSLLAGKGVAITPAQRAIIEQQIRLHRLPFKKGKKTRFTQQDLGKRLGVSGSVISSIERAMEAREP